MSDLTSYENLIRRLETKKSGDHAWFLSLLDDEKQCAYEDEHITAVLQMLRIARIRAHKNTIKETRHAVSYRSKDQKKTVDCRLLTVDC